MISWIREAEILCKSLDEELAGTPIYVLTQSDALSVDPRLRFDHYAGWTNDFADLLFSGLLHRRGQWQGRGFACVIDTRELRSRDQRLGTVLHELAHFLGYPLLPPDNGNRGAELGLGVAASQVLPRRWSNPLRTTSGEPPWRDHGVKFVRAASHIAYRAGKLNNRISPQLLSYAHYFPGACDERSFSAALQSEFEDSRTIRQIVETTVPPAFKDVWSAATQLRK